MISIPGQSGSTCDGFSRREFLRVGGAGLLGISLADILRLQAQALPQPALLLVASGAPLQSSGGVSEDPSHVKTIG